MDKRVVLVEFIDEADAFLEYCKENNLDLKTFKIIVLSSKVQVYLKKKNIAYESTLPYFDNSSHERCLLKAEELYQLLKNILHLEDESPVLEGYNNFVLFRIYYYLHHFLKIVELLYQINKKEKIGELYSCVLNVETNNFTITAEKERYLGILAKKFSEKNNIIFKEIPFSVPPLNCNQTIKKNTPKFFGKSILQSFDKLLLIRLSKKNTIMLTTTSYNFNLLAQSIRREIQDAVIVVKNDFDISAKDYVGNLAISLLKKNRYIEIYTSLHYLKLKDTKNYRESLSKNFDEFLSTLNDKFAKHFVFHEVDFFILVIKKLSQGIFNALMELQIKTLAVDDILDKMRPKLLLSPYSREINRNIAELTNAKEIPSICISHGSLVAPKNKLEKIDYYHIGLSLILNDYSYHCIQTPLAKEYIKHYNVKGKTIETGNLIFSKTQKQYRDRLREQILGENNSKYKLILHANTLKPRNTFFHWVETFDEFISGLNDVITAVNKIENTQLLVKLHPGAEINEDDLKLFLPKSNKFTVNKKIPFYQVLSAADLYIGFGSTAIEDALQNKIPVLLYDKWDRYKHCKAENIKRVVTPKVSPIYYLNDSENLTDSLRWILTNHSPNLIAESIFKQYLFSGTMNKNFFELIKDLSHTPDKSKVKGGSHNAL
jgi:hypothetical protein